VLYCNGPFCGKSKRLSEELIAAGYTNVRRYQLGIPMWRALVGITEIQLAGLVYVLKGDKTAVFLDVRSPEEFKSGSIPGAKSLPLADVKKAKDDGCLPMEDHNTRIIVFGRDGAQALAVTEAIAKEAFHNVSFFGGDINELMPKIEQIGNRKPKRLALVAVLLALSVPAQAQQSTKIPRIGYLTAKSQASSAPAPISTPSAKVYENSVTLRERTSSSSIEGPG
jgi:rhodanese-related sulfurtransferase